MSTDDETARLAARCYAEAAAPPTFQSATLLPGDGDLPRGVVVHASQPDLRVGVSRKWCSTIPVGGHDVGPAGVPLAALPTPLPTDAVVSVSPAGDHTLVIVNPPATSEGASKTASMELWGAHGFVKTLVGGDDSSDFAPHGRVHAPESTFGCIEWSPDRRRVLFCAEARVVVAPITTLFGRPSSTKPGTAAVDEFAWRESWGEQHTDAILPRLFVLDLGTGSIAPLVASQHLAGWSLGKGCWAPASAVDGENDGEVVFTAWPPGHRLGIIYCTNRPSQIFLTSLEQGSVPVHVAGTETASASSPTIAQPGGDVLLYLVTKVGGPHCQSAQLVARKWQPAHAAAGSSSTNASVVIIDHGVLYSTDLVGRKVWFQPDLVILQTNLCSRTQLLVADVIIDDATSAQQSAAGLGLGADVGNIINLAPHGRGDAILYEPTNDAGSDAEVLLSARPLIVWPHGGPHSMTTCAYSDFAAAFVRAGFVVVAPNYVGSAGYGDEGILELAAGGCGTLDVADVNAAATVVIESGLCSSDAVVAFGGSHGGFLTAHLSAQFPERYKATVIRNPVIDIASMVGSSDIPDWCWTESGGQYDPAVAPSGETLARMHAVSPLARVSAVRAPSLVLIGLKDLRVPVPQGFLWHNALRARGVATEVRTYPDDCHPLGSVKAAADTFVQSVTWMRRHLPSQ